MTKLTFKSLLILALSFGISVNLFAQAKKAPVKPVKAPIDKLLANKTFMIVIEPPKSGKKKPKNVDDVLSFKTNKLMSTYFQEEHFYKPSVYTVTVDTTYEEPEEVEAEEGAPADSVKAAPQKKMVKTYNFESVQTNDLEDEMTWVGQIIGDSISGTATAKLKKQKADAEYIFYGHAKSKPGKKTSH